MAADEKQNQMEESILSELAKNAEKIAEAEARCDSLRAYRGRLLIDARALPKPVSWSRLSAACGLADPSTIKAHNKAIEAQG
jgi:hypothetical protein